MFKNAIINTMWAALKKQIWERRGLWLTAPAVAGLIVGLRMTGWLQPYEWMALDQMFRLRPREAMDDRIVIVGIGESDLRTLRRWPLGDATLAKLLEKIQQQQPQVIGLDLYRDFPVEPGTADLAKVFETAPNLIGIENRGGHQNVPIAPPPILKKRGLVASNDIVQDGDGKIRRGMIYRGDENNNAQETLGLRLALIYLEAMNIQPKPATMNSDYLQLGQAVFPMFKANDGSYVRADDGEYQIMLNYRGSTGSFRTISVMDVLNDKVPAGLMRDRIVMIGPTAPSLKDFFYTPYSGDSITTPETMAGVEVQANLTSQILSSVLDGRSGIQSWNDWVEGGWIFLWAGVGVVLGWVARSPRRAIVGMIVTVGSLGLLCYGAFLLGWWIPLVPAAIALVISTAVLTSYIAFLEHAERQTIMNIFGRHVTPEIAEAIWRDRDQLLQEGRLTGREMTATVLFTDLKDFSSVSEKTSPEILMEWLNEYMEAMVKTVLDHGGIVDKFIGDSVMAVFGVPIARMTSEEIAHDAYQASKCAVKMAFVLESLNRKWELQGHPTTSMRVGISTGLVVTGSLGGRQRLDYTTIGDTVNIAARLESYDKTLEAGVCRILISESTYTLVQRHFPIRFIDQVQLRGREQSTKIYQILLESLSYDAQGTRRFPVDTSQ